MKRKTRLPLVLAVAAAAAFSVPGPSHAAQGARPIEFRTSAGAPPAQESWWGEVAKFGCRVGLGYIGTPGFNAFAGFCLLAFIDAMIS